MKKTICGAIGAMLLSPAVALATTQPGCVPFESCDPVSVPEPGTLPLLAAGLVVAAFLRFRKRNK